MKRKKDVKWSMQNGKCKRKQPQASVSGTHIISFPHHDIQHHQKEDKENDNNFFLSFLFSFFNLFYYLCKSFELFRH